MIISCLILGMQQWTCSEKVVFSAHPEQEDA
jgi:hypothetical protein